MSVQRKFAWRFSFLLHVCIGSLKKPHFGFSLISHFQGGIKRFVWSIKNLYDTREPRYKQNKTEVESVQLGIALSLVPKFLNLQIFKNNI